MIGCFFQRDRTHFARLLSVVTAEAVSCNLEQPGSKQGAVAKSICFAINDEHDFLGKFFAHGRLAATRAEERDQLWSVDPEEVGERMFASRLQECRDDRSLLRDSLIYDCVFHHALF
jgi:hypothetical protein